MLLPIPGRALKALRNGCGLRHYGMGAEGRGADSQMLWQQYRDCRASEPTDPPQTSVLWSNRANTVTIKCGSNNSNGTRWTTAAPGLRGETTARICFLLFIHGHGTHTHTHSHGVQAFIRPKGERMERWVDLQLTGRNRCHSGGNMFRSICCLVLGQWFFTFNA